MLLKTIGVNPTEDKAVGAYVGPPTIAAGAADVIVTTWLPLPTKNTCCTEARL